MMAEGTIQRIPSASVADSSDLIRVWLVRLDAPPDSRCELEKILSTDENERAGRYCFDRDRRRFTVTRAALRGILGRYQHKLPGEVKFQYGLHGKPAQSDPHARLRFNVSHSHEIAVVAVAQGREVGLDLEYRRPLADLEQLAAANFSPRELAVFRSLAQPARPGAFFAAWTRKEAYLKARGDGLTMSLNRFTVSIESHEPALLEVQDDPLEPDRWRMVDLPLPSGYAGALVAEGKNWHFDCVDWNW